MLTLKARSTASGQEHNVAILTVQNVLTGAKTSGVDVTYEENAILATEADIEGVTVSNEPTADLPTTFELDGNYPNPFNPTTTIRYALPEAAPVTLKVYDVMGREVATLVNGTQAAGRYTASWNARNASGQRVSSGIYFYTIEAGTFQQTRQMVLLK